jgi:hypothetical protein
MTKAAFYTGVMGSTSGRLPRRSCPLLIHIPIMHLGGWPTFPAESRWSVGLTNPANSRNERNQNVCPYPPASICVAPLESWAFP